MIEQDTIKLLRECDSGIKMGVAAFEQVQDKASEPKLTQLLSRCQQEHQQLAEKTEKLLDQYGDDGKDPNPLAQGMSWIKTNVMLAMEPQDQTIADLMTDGCNMGVKSLSRYLNQYQAAEEKAKEIAKKLIGIEEQLATDLRPYL